MRLLFVLLSSLFACSSADDSVLAITNTSVTSTDCGAEEIPDDILTVAVEDEVVQVVHEHYEESSCLTFDIHGSQDGSNLNIEYSESGAACDCIDLYRLEYYIEDLDPGTYILNPPGGESASVVIE